MAKTVVVLKNSGWGKTDCSRLEAQIVVVRKEKSLDCMLPGNVLERVHDTECFQTGDQLVYLYTAVQVVAGRWYLLTLHRIFGTVYSFGMRSRAVLILMDSC